MGPDPAQVSCLRPYSVMIIEDDADIRGLLEILLEGEERLAVVESLGNASDALEVVRTDRPDVVLCDVGLPGMSGLDALPLIRNACPDALIVMYTANPEGALGAMGLGADAVVGKDTGPRRLLGQVVELLDQRTHS